MVQFTKHVQELKSTLASIFRKRDLTQLVEDNKLSHIQDVMQRNATFKDSFALVTAVGLYLGICFRATITAQKKAPDFGHDCILTCFYDDAQASSKRVTRLKAIVWHNDAQVPMHIEAYGQHFCDNFTKKVASRYIRIGTIDNANDLVRVVESNEVLCNTAVALSRMLRQIKRQSFVDGQDLQSNLVHRSF